MLGPVAAAIFHQIGSLLVLLNAMRLLGFERSRDWPVFATAGRFAAACRRCRPSEVLHWASHHRRALTAGFGLLAIATYLGSGLTVIGPEQVGVLRRFGRHVPPLLRPGLHWRWPSPIESVTKAEPGLVRAARIGVSGRATSPAGPIAWGTTHGAARDESALFFTGDENLVELSGVAEYRDTEDGVLDRVFGVADLDAGVAGAAEAAFREVVGSRTLDEILVADRSDIETALGHTLDRRLAEEGLHVAVERVRIIDAHPPREVVPAYRDVSASLSDAERFRNDAEAYAGQRAFTSAAEAQEIRDRASERSYGLRTSQEGQSAAFLARQSAQATQPELTRFRLLSETLATALADRPKVLLDPRASGRRHLWLANPERFGLAPVSTPYPPASALPDEPED